jgi:cytochrome c-type biogenesis protein CcmE
MLKSTSKSEKVRQPGQWRFILGGVLIAAAILYLILSSTKANAQYFLTIDELLGKKDAMQDQSVRISGAVIGDSIQVNQDTLEIRFSMANIPGDQKTIDQQGGIAKVLHQAVTNGSSSTLEVVYTGVKPDLLKDEAQAIVTGTLGEDGVFKADELLLKCPTRYAEALPEQGE